MVAVTAYLEKRAEWLLQKAFRIIQECRQNSASRGKNSAIKVTLLKSLYLERDFYSYTSLFLLSNGMYA